MSDSNILTASISDCRKVLYVGSDILSGQPIENDVQLLLHDLELEACKVHSLL